MKKHVFVLSLLLLSVSSAYAGNGNNSNKPSNNNQQKGQMQMTAPPADCSKLSVSEQNFANQLTDMNNKSMFCSQFSPQQRQQAMQMMGQPDASGNTMNADQAVQQVMGSSPANQRKSRAGGGCPVK